jgi:hypothetical protein
MVHACREIEIFLTTRTRGIQPSLTFGSIMVKVNNSLIASRRYYCPSGCWCLSVCTKFGCAPGVTDVTGTGTVELG